MAVAYYTDELFLRHDAGPGHPERAARLEAVEQAVTADGFADSELVRLEAPAAPFEELTRVHDRDYLDAVAALCRSGGGSLDPDTAVNPASFDAATRSAGAGLDAVAQIRAGAASSAFVAARPPGHHARPHRAMGFCIVNSIAVVAAHLAAGGERVAILDWDAHHGNGTQEIFWTDPNVLFVSLHQYPFYPGSGAATDVGAGPGAGYTLNLPMPAGSGADDYFYAFERAVLPTLSSFRPDWLLVSAGYDAHYRDPLCDLRLPTKAFRRLASDVLGLGVPVIGFLEGGYDLTALGGSVRETVEVLAGGAVDVYIDEVPGGGGVHERVVAGVESALAARHRATEP